MCTWIDYDGATVAFVTMVDLRGKLDDGQNDGVILSGIGPI